MTETQIERLLRSAPSVSAPRQLLANLKAEISLERPVAPSLEMAVPWWKVWTPRLSFAALVLFGVVMLAVQGTQLQKIQQENQSLRHEIAGAFPPSTSAAPADAHEMVAKRLEELGSLQAEIESLRQELAQLPELRRQRDELRAQLSTAAAIPNPEDPFAAEKAKAERIACINNIKQIGLAARMWSNDNKETFPPDFLTMANNMNTPKILTCPSDKANLPAPGSWDAFDPGKVSYEWLAAGHDETQPDQVITRCRIHANVGLCDGSAHQLDPAKIEFFTENGRLKFRTKTAAWE